MEDSSYTLKNQDMSDRLRRTMEEALHQEEELEWKADYFLQKCKKMYCNWLAVQEKLRFIVWKDYIKENNNLKQTESEELSDYKAVYCPIYYRSNYPEIAREYGDTEKELLEYFLSEGFRCGHQGCVGFNVWSYREWNSDLKELFGDDLEKYYVHYIKEGNFQKRRAFGMPGVKEQTVFCGTDYAAVYHFYDYLYYNKDVLDAYGLEPDRVLRHFVEYGMDEGRRAKTDFNVVQYRELYTDLNEVFGGQYRKYFEHYLRDGQKEGRMGVYCGCA